MSSLSSICTEEFVDASDCEHRFARNFDHVASEREADHRVFGQAEFATAYDDSP